MCVQLKKKPLTAHPHSPDLASSGILSFPKILLTLTIRKLPFLGLLAAMETTFFDKRTFVCLHLICFGLSIV